jgi:hypothetical protein
MAGQESAVRRWWHRLAVHGAIAVTIVGGTAGSVTVAPRVAVAAEAPAMRAIFNDPAGGEAARMSITRRLVELIDGAETGSTIRVAMYYFASNLDVPRALVAARQRGVLVQVVTNNERAATDPHPEASAVYDLLRAGLGTNTGAGSFFYDCPADRGCIADLGDWSIMHNKFFLFTRTLGVSDVLVQSSANLSGGGWRDAGKGWNDAVEVPGNTVLFDGYARTFADLKAHRVDNNYYDTRGQVVTGRAKVWFMPRAGDSLNGHPGENAIFNILDNVSCSGNAAGGTSDHRTVIRVTMAQFGLMYLADKLVALDAAGCEVAVNLQVDPAKAVQVDVAEALLKRTAGRYGGVTVNYYCSADPIWIHSKNMVIDGKYYDVALEDDALADAYGGQWQSVAAAATHRAANGAGLAC